MKKILFCLMALFLFTAANAQDSSTHKKLVFNPKNPVYELAATCGTCMFKMEGKGCLLAVKFKGDKEGFCNAIKKAKVQGSVVGERFLVTYFELIK
jgi:hypothetical protein